MKCPINTQEIYGAVIWREIELGRELGWDRGEWGSRRETQRVRENERDSERYWEREGEKRKGGETEGEKRESKSTQITNNMHLGLFTCLRRKHNTSMFGGVDHSIRSSQWHLKILFSQRIQHSIWSFILDMILIVPRQSTMKYTLVDLIMLLMMSMHFDFVYNSFKQIILSIWSPCACFCDSPLLTHSCEQNIPFKFHSRITYLVNLS